MGELPQTRRFCGGGRYPQGVLAGGLKDYEKNLRALPFVSHCRRDAGLQIHFYLLRVRPKNPNQSSLHRRAGGKKQRQRVAIQTDRHLFAEPTPTPNGRMVPGLAARRPSLYPLASRLPLGVETTSAN